MASPLPGAQPGATSTSSTHDDNAQLPSSRVALQRSARALASARHQPSQSREAEMMDELMRDELFSGATVNRASYASTVSAATAAAADEEDEETAMARLKREQKLTVQMSAEASRRLVHEADTAKGIANQTMDSLRKQGEQLNRIERGGVQVERHLKEADRDLSTMERCCSCCMNCCGWINTRKPPKPMPSGRTPFTFPVRASIIPDDKLEGADADTDHPPTDKQPGRIEAMTRTYAPTGIGMPIAAPQPRTPFDDFGEEGDEDGATEEPKEVKSESLLPGDRYEIELERNMAIVEDVVASLRDDALLMSQELDAQKKHIERLNDTFEESNQHAWVVNQRTRSVW